jgi:hypothetical protein
MSSKTSKNMSRNVAHKQKGVKYRPCLGWCGGKMIKTDKSHRFCESCSKHLQTVANSGMGIEQSVPTRKGF